MKAPIKLSAYKSTLFLSFFPEKKISFILGGAGNVLSRLSTVAESLMLLQGTPEPGSWNWPLFYFSIPVLLFLLSSFNSPAKQSTCHQCNHNDSCIYFFNVMSIYFLLIYFYWSLESWSYISLIIISPSSLMQIHHLTTFRVQDFMRHELYSWIIKAFLVALSVITNQSFQMGPHLLAFSPTSSPFLSPNLPHYH